MELSSIFLMIVLAVIGTEAIAYVLKNRIEGRSRYIGLGIGITALAVMVAVIVWDVISN